MEDVFLTLSFIPALQQSWCIKNVQWGSLFVQTITPSSKPHRAPVVLGMKDEPTPLWDLQRFRQNWNNCTKQQWIWTTDGRVCKCLRNEPVCSICLHFKGIVRPKVIILSFTHFHFDPVWIFVNNDFNAVPHSKLLYGLKKKNMKYNAQTSQMHYFMVLLVPFWSLIAYIHISHELHGTEQHGHSAKHLVCAPWEKESPEVA